MSNTKQNKSSTAVKTVRDSKREEILYSAMRVFSFFGYYGATLDKIADEAGVSKALVIKYYGTKENLVAKCLNKFSRSFCDKLKRISQKNLDYDRRAEEIFQLLRLSQNEMRFILSIFLTPSLDTLSRTVYNTFWEECKEMLVFPNGCPDIEFTPGLSYNLIALYIHYLIDGKEDIYIGARNELMGCFFLSKDEIKSKGRQMESV